MSQLPTFTSGSFATIGIEGQTVTVAKRRHSHLSVLLMHMRADGIEEALMNSQSLRICALPYFL